MGLPIYIKKKYLLRFNDMPPFGFFNFTSPELICMLLYLVNNKREIDNILRYVSYLDKGKSAYMERYCSRGYYFKNVASIWKKVKKSPRTMRSTEIYYYLKCIIKYYFRFFHKHKTLKNKCSRFDDYLQNYVESEFSIYYFTHFEYNPYKKELERKGFTVTRYDKEIADIIDGISNDRQRKAQLVFEKEVITHGIEYAIYKNTVFN